MSGLIDIQFKTRRDLLVISCLIIFINLAEISISQFAVLGVKGTAGSPDLALYFLYAIGVYMAWRYWGYNANAFKRLQISKHVFLTDKAIDSAQGTKRIPGKKNFLLNSTPNAENELVHSLSFDYSSKGGQTDNQSVGVKNEDIEKWNVEFDKSKAELSKHILEAWFPLVIAGLALSSAIVAPIARGDQSNITGQFVYVPMGHSSLTIWENDGNCLFQAQGVFEQSLVGIAKKEIVCQAADSEESEELVKLMVVQLNNNEAAISYRSHLVLLEK